MDAPKVRPRARTSYYLPGWARAYDASVNTRPRPLRLSARATNLGLLALVLAGVATGLGDFLAGAPSDRWVLWLHSIGGFALLLLLVWKRRIILGSLRRHGLGLWALPSLLLLVILFAALISGILWSTSGLPTVAGESGLTLHAALSIALALMLLPHARAGWRGLPPRRAIGRRALIKAGVLLGAGIAAWRGSELLSAAADLPGAKRRFTGSRDAGSFTGNLFPSNAWLFDDPDPLDPTTWRLDVRGMVRSPQKLALSELTADQSLTATLDCTGGWFSTQQWHGTPLGAVLQRAGVQPGAKSVVVRSATGFWRRFSIEDAQTMLLATRVGGESLADEHGAPLRLVAAGRRGYDWVKWVTAVEVSAVPPWWKWPLPVS